MSHVLIATLGDSPIVVTSMYDLLTKTKQQSLDKIIVICSSGDYRDGGIVAIDEALKGECEVEDCQLEFEDVYDEDGCFHFLQELYKLLRTCQQQGDVVYLSLAGGRKNMSALMALLAPMFKTTCLKGLYHVIDTDEDTDRTKFRDIDEIIHLYEHDAEQFLKVMHPDVNSLELVRIPLESIQAIPEEDLQRLSTSGQVPDTWNLTEDQLYRLKITNDNLLQVYLTERAKKEFEKCDGSRADDFQKCFKNMLFPGSLAKKWHLTLHVSSLSYPMHFHKESHTAERPLYHTEPEDIVGYPNSRVEKVIIERLAKHRNDKKYEPTIEQLEHSLYEDDSKLYALEEILKADQPQPIPSILIVPMGTHPMVATQLYTLLTDRKQRKIQRVILLYPETAGAVENAVLWAKEAFEHEKIACTLESVKGLSDIRSENDCRLYQEALERLIKNIQATHPDWHIDLALSGGRKGMAVMAFFAAQRMQLGAIYHTLIGNKALDLRIEHDMHPQHFDPLRQREKNEKLFLRAYEAYKNNFHLFTVPIGPLRGK